MAKVLLVLFALAAATLGDVVTLPPVSLIADVSTGPVIGKANITIDNDEVDYDIGEWVYLANLPGPVSLPVNQSMQAIGVFGENSWAVMNGSLSVPGCYSAWEAKGALGLVGSDAAGSVITCLFGTQLLTVLLDPAFVPVAKYVENVA